MLIGFGASVKGVGTGLCLLGQDMNLRQLQYFRAVVEHGSLSAASLVLHVAQPPLSVAIRQLEDEWNVSLFDRVGRGLMLTEAGRSLYQRACQLLAHADALDEEMIALGRGLSACVRVGVTSFSIELVSRMAETLRREQQAVSIALHLAEPQALEDMVERHDLDFALTHLPVASAALHVEPLRKMPLHVVLQAQDGRFDGLCSLRLKTLDGLPLVMLRRSAGGGVYSRTLQAFHERRLSCQVVAMGSDLALVLALVRQGIGLGVLPLPSPRVLPEGLRACPIEDLTSTETLALIRAPGQHVLPAVERGLALCRDLLKA
jgi:LysR family transcriptional regulator, salicylic acid-responsive activator of bsdBCD